MTDNGIGYYTKETVDGRIELFVGVGDGVLLSEGVFDSLEDIDRYIERNEE
ncbi:MAG: hypothetical protein WBV68_08240 [Exiguobacterium oxidotolerans]